jgi:hypothetical protein
VRLPWVPSVSGGGGAAAPMGMVDSRRQVVGRYACKIKWCINPKNIWEHPATTTNFLASPHAELLYRHYKTFEQKQKCAAFCIVCAASHTPDTTSNWTLLSVHWPVCLAHPYQTSMSDTGSHALVTGKSNGAQWRNWGKTGGGHLRKTKCPRGCCLMKKYAL